MMTRSLLALLLLSLWLTACFKPTREQDCLLDGTCECKRTSDCAVGQHCVDGRCIEIPDAGQPGELGWPCESNDICLSKICLPKGPGNGGVCTVLCDADQSFSCPRGWDCKTSLEGKGLVCAPPYQSQCQGCQVDTDCNTAGDRCLQLGAGERGCASDCTLSGCLAGSTCRSVQFDAGVTARLCVPDGQTCECSQLTAGLTRSCNTANTVGTCFGVETCLADAGWSGCDAPPASREVCDGRDNDCDGLTDQADPDLDTSPVPGYPDCRKGVTCTGRWACGALPGGDAGFVCSAPDPVEEACNGIDDDCDGLVDDGIIDSLGRYTGVRACGSCNTDCYEAVLNLATDGGADAGPSPGSVACVDRAGTFTCSPLQCAKGYFPSPPSAPTVCEKAVTPQCRPCTSSGDCVVPGDACLTVGMDVGTFCAQSCDVTAPYPGCTGVTGERGCCPMGNTCQAVTGGKRCVPDGSSCLCSADRAGFSRSCFQTAGAATCVGQQVCQLSGTFGICDTSNTTVELCDGADNDCDGTIDDGFVNTRGTGTYDTDEHCGACQNNCKARWSPTIQHAIGGCATQAAPVCAIVACTTEAVGGGGACRVDSECSGTRTCHPLYRQCVQTCTTAAECGPGGQCLGGSCTRTCTNNTECEGVFGRPSTCASGLCGVTYQFKNADTDDTNGCECPSSPAADEPDLSLQYPTAGLPYVDRNCDTVDGVATGSLFVWAQSPSSLGTRAAPFKTLREAILAFNAAQHSAILVAQGTYVEQVVLRNGVSVHGGYSPDFSRRDIITFPTLIEAPEPDWSQSGARRGTVNAEDLTTRTVIAGFTVRGYDITSRTMPGQPARNTFAVYARNAPALVVQNNHIVGGRGGDALAALPGFAGANGVAGRDGLVARECNSPNCTGETQAGGGGGANAACPGTTQGNPGAGSDLSRNPQDYSNTANGNGRGGSNGVYNHSSPTQAALCKYDCTVPANGLNGGAAQNGADGVSLGAGTSCALPMGGLSGDDWASPAATAGGPGQTGRGGGGGGAGGCVRNDNPATCTIGRRVGDLGATGGGGGGAGCGGGSGQGAAGGGASFGLFVIGGAPSIIGNLVDVGFGGTGGPGGAGGYGGLGGQGGRGGTITSVAWCAGLGGPGGRGGNGGAGSGGGGGCGGSAFGIAGTQLPVTQLTITNTLAPTPLNAGGSGGVGGASPAGPAFKGADGQAGLSVPVHSF